MSVRALQVGAELRCKDPPNLFKMSLTIVYQ